MQIRETRIARWVYREKLSGVQCLFTIHLPDGSKGVKLVATAMRV